MPATAIDIGTYTIKAVVAKPGAKPNVSLVVEMPNNTGKDIPQTDNDVEQMSELMKAFFSTNNLPTNDLRLSLPDKQVSTKVIEIPPLSDAELASAIPWQAEQHIPIPKDQLSLEYQVLYRPERKSSQENMKVLLVGVRKTLIERYIAIFNNLGFEPTILESQMLSVIRSLGFTITDPTTLVVHMGASETILAVVHQGLPSFIFNHSNGGNLLSKTLEQSIGLTAQQAEEYKRSFGLNPSQFGGKIKNALETSLVNFTSEFQRANRFFVNKNPAAAIQRVVISGGSAQLPGLVEYLSSKLNIEVLLASPFAASTGNIPQTNHQAMSVCMGLIMKQS